MKEITYKDYYRYKNTFDTFNSYTLREEELEYSYDSDNINNTHDKLFRDLFADEEEVAKLLNKFFKFRKEVKSSELEKYNSSFITQSYKNQESDIVYKLKERNIFFLIEHQSYVDYSMSYRILNYAIEIIRNAIDLKELQCEGYKYPKVIPIVIYTGNRKWNSVLEYQTLEEKIIGYDKSDINAKYNLLDSNNYTKSELLENESFISKVIAVEKCKTKQELIETLEYIIENIEFDKDKIMIERIIKYILSQILEKGEINRFLQKLKNKKEVVGMLAENLMKEKMQIIRKANNEGIIEGKREGKIEGKKEGRIQIITILIKNMLQENESEEKIKKYLEISNEEFEEYKKMQKSNEKFEENKK